MAIFKIKKVPKKESAHIDRERQIKVVKNLSMGSVPLQNGNVISEKELTDKKKKLSKYSFSR